MFKIDILGNLEGRFFKVREDFFFIYRIFYLLCSISFNSYTFIRLFLFFYSNRRILINQEFKRKKERIQLYNYGRRNEKREIAAGMDADAINHSLA